MKKYYIYIFTILGIISCTDYLEIKPQNVLAIVNYDEVKALLGANLKMYANPGYGESLSQTSISYLQEDFWLFFHLYSDDVDTDKYYSSSAGRNNKVLFAKSINWDNTDQPGFIWKSYYLNIGFYNTILDELSKVDASKVQADIVKFEAKVLRAWHIFKLMQYFSPYKLNKYGIPLNLDAQMVGEYNDSRKTQKEVYDIIISELTECLECETAPKETYNVFYDKRIINAILAQVYLFKGDSGAKLADDYNNAINCANAAIKGRVLGKIDSYTHFPVLSDLGVSKQYEQALYVDARTNYVISDIVGTSNYNSQYPTEELYNMYDENDIRKSYFFDENKRVIKFSRLAPEGSWSTYDIYQFWSVAEMHLIIAESYARMGDIPNAKKWLEDFQRNRIVDYVGYVGSDVDILQNILDERRKEFCFEYDMRWCDLARLQTGWERNSNDEENSKCIIAGGDYRFALPIPVLEELQYNDIEQNPGWLKN